MPQKKIAIDHSKAAIPQITGTSIKDIVAGLNPVDAEVYLIFGDGFGFIGQGDLIKLGTIKAISYSVFRDKVPVRAIGTVSPRGYTRGTRTIAGSMVFSVIERSAFDLLRTAWAAGDRVKYGDMPIELSYDKFPFGMLDQLPPFDIFIQFNTEFGDTSHLIIYGIELFSTGVSISINNSAIDEVIRYQARALEEIKKDGKKVYEIADKKYYNKRVHTTVETLYLDTVARPDRINIIRELARKANPFF